MYRSSEYSLVSLLWWYHMFSVWRTDHWQHSVYQHLCVLLVPFFRSTNIFDSFTSLKWFPVLSAFQVAWNASTFGNIHAEWMALLSEVADTLYISLQHYKRGMENYKTDTKVGVKLSVAKTVTEWCTWAKNTCDHVWNRFLEHFGVKTMW